MKPRVEPPTSVQELAVLKAVVYASLFDYPLTLDQLHQSLVGVRASRDAVAAWRQSSDLLQATVEHRDGWFFPAGRTDLIETRRRRESLSRELLERDKRVLWLISCVPFVRMGAVSGSLAHLNAEGSADLDLFVITAPRRVWAVTVAILVLTKLLGWRKHLCLNYVVSERALRVTPEDLFSANQIMHLRPVFGHHVFDRFVKANAFVRDHYPNFELPAAARSRPHVFRVVIERILSFGPAQVAERAARVLYGWHLERKSATWRSRDQVRLESETLKLHTSSHRADTMRRFERAVQEAANFKADRILVDTIH